MTPIQMTLIQAGGLAVIFLAFAATIGAGGRPGRSTTPPPIDDDEPETLVKRTSVPRIKGP